MGDDEAAVVAEKLPDLAERNRFRLHGFVGAIVGELPARWFADGHHQGEDDEPGYGDDDEGHLPAVHFPDDGKVEHPGAAEHGDDRAAGQEREPGAGIQAHCVNADRPGQLPGRKIVGHDRVGGR